MEISNRGTRKSKVGDGDTEEMVVGRVGIKGDGRGRGIQEEKGGDREGTSRRDRKGR